VTAGVVVKYFGFLSKKKKKVPLHDAIYKKYCNVNELLKYKISTSSNVHRLKKNL